MYQALYRKWRPQSFDDVVGQGHITNTLRRQVAAEKTSHAYLFTGTRGTGKTSCAKILARAVNCERPENGNPCNVCPSCIGVENGSIMDVLELDAASNNGVDQIRALREEAVFTPAAVKKRVYIVDEVHMLTTAAFNALLKILEEPPEHLMFILATTELHKVPATIRSRCQQFAFKRISPQDIALRLLRVAQAENIVLTQEGAQLLARLANGGMRDALSLLDQCAGDEGETLDEATILDHLSLAGNVDTARLFRAIAAGDPAKALEIFSSLYAAGKEAGAVLGELSTLVRDLLICAAAPQGGQGLLTGGYERATLSELSALRAPEELLAMLTQLQRSSAELGRSSNPRTDAEVCLMRLCGMQTAQRQPMQAQASAAPQTPAASQAPIPQTPKAQAAAQPGEAEAPPFTPTPAVQHLSEAEAAPANQAEPKQATVLQAPVEQPAPPAPAPQSKSAESDAWLSLAQGIVPKLPVSIQGEFASTDKVYGRLEGSVLHLYVASHMCFQMIARPKNLAAIEKAASELLGLAVRCKVEEGIPMDAPSLHLDAAPTQQQEPEGGFDALLALSDQGLDIVFED